MYNRQGTISGEGGNDEKHYTIDHYVKSRQRLALCTNAYLFSFEAFL